MLCDFSCFACFFLNYLFCYAFSAIPCKMCLVFYHITCSHNK
jgi:hypothetical protein